MFVPNIWNPGAPIHAAYHLLSRAKCRHAERGDARLRTRAGLVRFLKQRRLAVVASVYIDAPPIRNTAFSLRELKQALGARTDGLATEGRVAADPEPAWRRIQAHTR